MITIIIIRRVDSYAEINDDVLLKQNKADYYTTLKYRYKMNVTMLLVMETNSNYSEFTNYTFFMTIV